MIVCDGEGDRAVLGGSMDCAGVDWDLLPGPARIEIEAGGGGERFSGEIPFVACVTFGVSTGLETGPWLVLSCGVEKLADGDAIVVADENDAACGVSAGAGKLSDDFFTGDSLLAVGCTGLLPSAGTLRPLGLGER